MHLACGTRIFVRNLAPFETIFRFNPQFPIFPPLAYLLATTMSLPFLISSALRFVSAQRLARLNCPYCREEYEPPRELLEKLDAPKSIKFYHSLGCSECGNKGVKGRQGVHEVLIVTKKIEELIMKRPSDEQINKIATEEGMTMLRQAALQKVYEGIISIEEALILTE